MSTLTLAPPPPQLVAPAAPPEPADYLWRLSVAQYHAMIRAGIVSENDPVELLNGLLVQTMPINPRHTLASELVCEWLSRSVGPGWFVRRDQPLTLATSEPEPDAFVVRGRRQDYANRHPGPADVALVVEVADSSLAVDRGAKRAAYATAGIACYWIVNLVERQIEVYTEPAGAQYARRQDFGPADELPLVIDGQEVGRVTVGELMT